MLMIKQNQYKVMHVQHLTPTVYIIRIERNGLEFRAGQYINLGKAGDFEKRDYSIYSPEGTEYIEVLVKEVEEGMVSKTLKSLVPGEYVNIDGPFGFFTLNEVDIQHKKFLFIASGTGIAPFHSIVNSYPELNYKIIHGVRYLNESYGREDYPDDSITLCISGEKGGDFNGRITNYLEKHTIDPETQCYLCGNADMICEVYDILKAKGIPSGNLNSEVYF